MSLEGLQKRLSQELEKFKNLQKDFEKILGLRQQLEAQLTENNVVKEEMDLLEGHANVYKLMGPVLVKQDLTEARQTVNKRIEYITNELKRQEQAIQDIEKKHENEREIVNKLQQQFQQAKVKAAIKA